MVKALTKEILAFGFDRLKANLKPKELLAEPDMPTAFMAEMAFSGHIVTPTPTSGPTFFNPGSYPNQGFLPNQEVNYENYPAYNNALGSFALLNTPKILKARGDVFEKWSSIGTLPFEVRRFFSTYKINEPIKFVLNPSLDINFNNTKISAAYYLVPTSNFAFIEDGGDLFSIYNDPDLLPDKINFDANVATEVHGDLITEFVPLECFYEMIASVQYRYPNDFYLPGFFSANDDTDLINRFNTEKLFVKLLIEYEFNSLNSDGEPNRSTEVYTIPVEIIEPNNPSIFSPFESSYNLNDYEQVIALGDVHYTTNTIIHASKTVVIQGEITVEDGVTVNIFAGEEIIQQPESSISATGSGVVNLSIVPVLECQDPAVATQASAAYVHNFCNGLSPEGNYMANVTNRAFVPNTQTETIREIDLRVSPMGSGQFILSSQNATDNNRNFRLFDIKGRLLLEGRELPQTLDMTTYASGIYLIEYATENGVSRKKLSHY